jgi:hypothetical protein
MEPEVACTLPATVAGLELALSQTLMLRRTGHKTRLVERTISGFPVLTVVATPPRRPTRRERGALC